MTHTTFSHETSNDLSGEEQPTTSKTKLPWRLPHVNCEMNCVLQTPARDLRGLRATTAANPLAGEAKPAGERLTLKELSRRA
jgi:hypothetical protein